MSCKIYVVYHEPMAYRKSEVFAPICVGRRKDEFPQGFLRDDEGDNIADKNDVYNELTALYRVWKDENLHADYMGLAHYRRYLGLGLNESHYLYRTPEKAFRRIRKTEKNWLALSGADLVAPNPAHYKSVKDYYALAHGQDDVKTLLSVFKKDFPDYYDCAEKYFSGSDDYLCNLVVMKKDIFMRYASFLFAVLNKFVEKREKEGRLFVSERITGVFIQKMIDEGKDVRFAPVVTIEPREELGAAILKVRNSEEKGKQKWKPLVHAMIPTAMWRRYYRKVYEVRKK